MSEVGTTPAPSARFLTWRRICVQPGYRVLLAAALLSGVTLILIAVTGRDISSRRFLANDVLLRAGSEQTFAYRFLDPSPFCLWLPSDSFVRRNLASGSLPVWDRRQGGGYSPLNGFQNGVFFPLRWIVALFPAPLAQSALLIGGLFLCWCGAFVLLWRSYGFSEGGALVGSLLFTFSGGSLAGAHFTGVLMATLLLPWILIAYLGMARKPSYCRFLGLSLLLTLLLASGHPAAIFAVSLTVGVSIVSDMVVFKRSLRILALVFASAVSALFLSSVFLIPTFLFVRSSWTYKLASAQGISYEAVRTGFWLQELASLLFLPSDKAPLDHIFFYSFLGFPAVVLIFGGMVSVRRRRELAPLLFWLPLSYLLAFPGADALTELLRNVPLVRYCKGWYLIPLFLFPAAIAAAAGFDEIGARKTSSSRALLAGMAFFAILLEGIAAGRAFSPHRYAPLKSPALEWLNSQERPFRILGLRGQTHLPNMAELTGVEDLRITSPMLSFRYHSWFELVDPLVREQAFPTTRIPSRVDSPLLGTFNVRYVVQSRLQNEDMHSQLGKAEDSYFRFTPPSLVRDPLLPVVYSDRFVEILENRRAYRPRAHFADSVHVVDGGSSAAASWMRSHPAELGRTFVVESSSLPNDSHQGPVRATVEVAYPADAEVVLRTKNEANSLLVLHDMFDEGWKAEVDGKVTPILPVNLISRGVFLNRGAHVVTMRYRPPGLATGLAISLAVLLLLLTPMLQSFCMRRRHLEFED